LATQTERRFDLVHLEAFRYDADEQIAAWTAHLAGLEHQLRLLKAAPGMLTTGRMPEYLFRRTSGVVGLLERLIEDGCTEALDSGAERLTEAAVQAPNRSCKYGMGSPTATTTVAVSGGRPYS
jgi:hypothetical protein